MHRNRVQPELEAMMTVRSLVLVALVGALSLGRVSESHAITSCDVCEDEAHPCNFPCYIGSPTGHNVTSTTCKGAGYKCIRKLPVTSEEACPGLALTVAQTDATAAIDPIEATAGIDVVTLAAAWLRDGIALVTGIVDRVALLESGARVQRTQS
jgi:hypothetical protein